MKRINVVIIHLVFWTMFVIVPMLIFRLDDFHRGRDIVYFLQQTFINVVVFYLTYWLLIPRLMKRRGIFNLVWIGLLWIVILAAIRLTIVYYFKEVIRPLEGHPFIFVRQLLHELFGTMMFTLYGVLIYFSIEWFRERQYRFELIREKQKSEIDLLKSQISPHFLMNTLNNLYSLVYQGSKQASDAVLKLSDIMRYLLYDTKTDLVPLENEVKYLESFIELQMLRFRNRDLVSFKITGELNGRMVAPMIFIPFVENAFKHGSKIEKGSGITLKLAVEEKKILFKVINIKAKRDIQKDAEKGIGLENVRMRLELQYPEKYDLRIKDEGERYEVYLEIYDR